MRVSSAMRRFVLAFWDKKGDTAPVWLLWRLCCRGEGQFARMTSDSLVPVKTRNVIRRHNQKNRNLHHGDA
ncbi:hypothetical protein C0V97_10825 [Asaia sp. W19]|nr:hypothetical protein C0V97_10825 [Asaia sp. W19]